MMLPPAVVVHSVEQARFARSHGCAVTLLSAPAAGLYAGCLWWRAVVDAAGGGPDLIDCADAPGRALEALVVGCRAIVLRPCPAWPGVAERVAAAGATLLDARPEALDLAQRGAARRIAAWLAVG